MVSTGASAGREVARLEALNLGSKCAYVHGQLMVWDSILRLCLNVSTPRVTVPSRGDQDRVGSLRKNA